ncbi:MAG: DegV family protein [Defluviitaleaceae bacterium]|nr:DegV family protein [Defluviitaleaceae bacterium]MCL2238543.1 DegV family protein [Defluviitaleaceae bacterium]
MQNGIVVDSGCDVDRKHIESETCTISYVPLNLQVEEMVYHDDEALNLDEYLAHMEASTQGVKTSAPSPGMFVERFGLADNIFAVTLSSKLSATYQSAVTAKRMYLDEYGKKFIHIFDSLSASVGEGVIAMKIAELLKNGIPNTDIVEQVNQFMGGMRTYFILDKFDNLVKTGRINPYIARIASFLGIKPICADQNGEIKMLDKARGYTKSMKRLVEIIKANTPDIESRIISITHVKAIEKALALKDELLHQLRARDVLIQECRGVTTTYANRGGVVVAL